MIRRATVPAIVALIAALTRDSPDSRGGREKRRLEKQPAEASRVEPRPADKRPED